MNMHHMRTSVASRWGLEHKGPGACAVARQRGRATPPWRPLPRERVELVLGTTRCSLDTTQAHPQLLQASTRCATLRAALIVTSDRPSTAPTPTRPRTHMLG